MNLIFIRQAQKIASSLLAGIFILLPIQGVIAQETPNEIEQSVIDDISAIATTTTKADVVQETHDTPISKLLLGKTFKEKANIKGDRMSKVKIEEAFSSPDGNLTVSILDINKIEDGVEVFVKAWKDNEQVGFGPDGTVEIEKIKIINPPILVRENGKLKEDLERALKESILHTVSVIAKDGSNIEKGKVGRTTTTTYPAAGANTPADGRCTEDRYSSWSTTRNGSTCRIASVSDLTGIVYNKLGSGSGSGHYSVTRHFTLFDVSSIPDTDTITSATYSVYGTSWDTSITGSEQRVHVVSASPASNNGLVTTDYDNVGSISFGETDNSWDTSGYNDVTLNASGTAAISKTSITKFAMRGNYDYADVAPDSSNMFELSFYHADQSGTTNDPKLTVTHGQENITRIYAQPSDGYVTNSYCNESGSWSAVRGYSSSLALGVCDTQDFIKVRSDAEDSAYQIYRGSLVFDTSTIPDGSVITAASLKLYGDASEGENTTGLVAVSHTRASTTDLAVNDWHISDFGSTSLGSTTIPLATSTYNQISLNSSGLYHINDTGITLFGLLTANDFNNSDPGTTKKEATFVSANASGTSTDPYLEVTYIY